MKQPVFRAAMFVLLGCACAVPLTAHAQEAATTSPARGTDAADAQILKRAADWVGSLKLSDPEKEGRIRTLVADHMRTTRDWHNDHPYTAVPEGINPATGLRLTKGDRQFIAVTTIPPTVRQQFLAALERDLTPEQIVVIKDHFSEGKVDFTLKGYYAIVPDLTDEEAKTIRGFLESARELALDVKVRSDMTNACFEIYKTKAEQYLNSNGRNWKALFSAYVKKARDAKAARAATQPATAPAK